jgi:hypothetical protein
VQPRLAKTEWLAKNIIHRMAHALILGHQDVFEKERKKKTQVYTWRWLSYCVWVVEIDEPNRQMKSYQKKI